MALESFRNTASALADRSVHAAALLSMLVLGTLLVGARVGLADPLGRLQGKVLATDTGEPIGFADVLLIPSDTTLRKVGGLTHADGTFLLEAEAG